MSTYRPHKVGKNDDVALIGLSDNSVQYIEFVCNWTPVTDAKLLCSFFIMANFEAIKYYPSDKMNQLDNKSSIVYDWLSETSNLADALFIFEFKRHNISPPLLRYIRKLIEMCNKA